jgi:D-tyrosyl-tRNA(Tyr) deacylase
VAKTVKEAGDMRAVIQRAIDGRVEVDGRQVSGFLGQGLVVLLAITHDDGPDQVATMIRKIAELRLLRGELNVLEAAAPVMLISQFTLYADTKKGRRPSWSAAAPAAQAEPLVEQVAVGLEERGIVVARGVFGADMQVSLTNDGPVTIFLET